MQQRKLNFGKYITIAFTVNAMILRSTKLLIKLGNIMAIDWRVNFQYGIYL